jgi:hypothetical protein
MRSRLFVVLAVLGIEATLALVEEAIVEAAA